MAKRNAKGTRKAGSQTRTPGEAARERVVVRRRPKRSELDALTPEEMVKRVPDCLPTPTTYPAWEALIALGQLADHRFACNSIREGGEARYLERQPREMWLLRRRVFWLPEELRERSVRACPSYAKVTDASELHAAICDYADNWTRTDDPIADFLHDGVWYRALADRVIAAVAVENPDLADMWARGQRLLAERSKIIPGAKSSFDLARRMKVVEKEWEEIGDKIQAEWDGKERAAREAEQPKHEPSGAVEAKLYRAMDATPRKASDLCKRAGLKTCDGHARQMLSRLLHVKKLCKYEGGYYRPACPVKSTDMSGTDNGD